jgi:hypothetical protein
MVPVSKTTAAAQRRTLVLVMVRATIARYADQRQGTDRKARVELAIGRNGQSDASALATAGKARRLWTTVSLVSYTVALTIPVRRVRR